MRNRQEISVKGITHLSWALNVIEISALIGIVIIVLQRGFTITVATLRPIVLTTCLLLMVNNVVNLSLTSKWLRADEQHDMLKDALGHVEKLNSELRTQKHDFLNHLQVVFSLVEMGEGSEACEYIEKIHGDMQSRSLTARTAKPAVNALLQAKLADCAKRGIDAQVRISSGWRMLPIEEWEMCRVLGNIIDNATEALKAVEDKRLVIDIYEDVLGYGFTVANNGPEIPKAILDRIWHRGFSTKGSGRGMGLNIVRSIMESGGGTVAIDSSAGSTVFTGHLPLGINPPPPPSTA